MPAAAAAAVGLYTATGLIGDAPLALLSLGLPVQPKDNYANHRDNTGSQTQLQ